jgi:hypothetical protein
VRDLGLEQDVDADTLAVQHVRGEHGLDRVAGGAAKVDEVRRPVVWRLSCVTMWALTESSSYYAAECSECGEGLLGWKDFKTCRNSRSKHHHITLHLQFVSGPHRIWAVAVHRP